MRKQVGIGNPRQPLNLVSDIIIQGQGIPEDTVLYQNRQAQTEQK
jgi:hypothetical protein